MAIRNAVLGIAGLEKGEAVAEIGEVADFGHLWQMVAGTAEERIQVLREVQKAEVQTKTVNRHAARERLLWIAVIFRLLEFSRPGPPGTRTGGRAEKDIIQKIFEKDLESLLRREK